MLLLYESREYSLLGYDGALNENNSYMPPNVFHFIWPSHGFLYIKCSEVVYKFLLLVMLCDHAACSKPHRWQDIECPKPYNLRWTLSQEAPWIVKLPTPGSASRGSSQLSSFQVTVDNQGSQSWLSYIICNDYVLLALWLKSTMTVK